MADQPEVTVLRFGWAYHAVGLLFVFLAALFPLLMAWNGESFDATVVTFLVAFAVAGALSVLYTRAYEVRILHDGFVVTRLWSRPREVQWSQVVAARVKAGSVKFETAGGQTVTINGYLPDLRRLMLIADERLPKSAWRE